MPELPGRFRLVRGRDLLVVDVELVNLRVSDDGQRLERVDTAAPAGVVLHLPAQHVAERAFFETDTSREPVAPLPATAVAAGPTRLAFKLPTGIDSLPLTTEALLGWDRLEPVLAPNALPPGAIEGPRTGLPGIGETAIEFPWRLMLSPDANARWTHRTEPFSDARRTEIWHTRLVGDDVPLRAVGRRSVRDSFRSALSDRDLDDIVTLTSDFGIRPRSVLEHRLPRPVWEALLDRAGVRGFRYKPLPLRAERFMLSALGASVRMRGAWGYPEPAMDPAALRRFGMPTPGLEQYEHIAGWGRDQYVRVVRRGCMSSGHRASIVKVTERRFEPTLVRTIQTPQGPQAVFGNTAVLRQYFQIVIQEPLVDYRTLSAGYRWGGREMPLRTLEFTTTVTPKIDLPIDPDEIEKHIRDNWARVFPTPEEDELAVQQQVQRAIEERLALTPFWVRVGLRDLEFAATGTDWEGQPVSLSMPLMFVPYELLGDAGHFADVNAEFLGGSESRRTRPLGNQRVAVADPTGSKPGSTQAPVESLTFALQEIPAGRPGLPRGYRPGWVLTVTGADVHLETAERVTGRPARVRIRWANQYLAGGPNPSAVFAELVDGPLALGFPAERGGGLARPDASIGSLSSRQGAMPAAFTKPSVTTADMAAMFGPAKLFGAVPLSALLARVDLGPGDFDQVDLPDDALDRLLGSPGQPMRVPVLRTRPVFDVGNVPVAMESRFVWKPELASTDVGGLSFEFDEQSALVLDARSVTPLAGGEPRSELRGELREFTLGFVEVVSIRFDRLAFAALPGRKPDITAEGFDLTFEGPLRFVNTLKEILPADGFSDPPAVRVSPEGISAGYTLGIPTFGVGIFSLQNLSLSAALAIPFNDQPASFRFAVAERHKPFLVTVTLFGGGGFFALEVSAKGVESVEASIEFGGSLALNLGVASGGVTVMAGIYFGLKGRETVLTGYLRCGGHLSVLGIVSISVEFYLGFTYRNKGGDRSEVWGQARISVAVKIAFFSMSVSLGIEKRFAGAAGDPTFEQVTDPADWEQYCLAFTE